MPQMRRDHQRIARVLASQDLLEAAVQRRIHLGRNATRPSSMSSATSVTLDAVERADNDASSGVAHRYLVLLTLGAIARVIRYRIGLQPLGVAALDSDDSATNHALGISVGNPTGMPAIDGVTVNGCPGSSNSGAVQLMQA